MTNVSASSRLAIRAVASIGARLDASAPVAQGIERAPPERKVAGSIPARRIGNPVQVTVGQMGLRRMPDYSVGQALRDDGRIGSRLSALTKLQRNKHASDD